jgi:hypothetical protein
MPRYFFHLIGGDHRVLDLEGVNLDSEAVERYALMNARDCIAGDVADGRLDLRSSLEVRDEDGKVVHRLLFADAVKMMVQ